PGVRGGSALEDQVLLQRGRRGRHEDLRAGRVHRRGEHVLESGDVVVHAIDHGPDLDARRGRARGVPPTVTPASGPNTCRPLPEWPAESRNPQFTTVRATTSRGAIDTMTVIGRAPGVRGGTGATGTGGTGSSFGMTGTVANESPAAAADTA